MPAREKELLKKIINLHNNIQNNVQEKQQETEQQISTDENMPQPKKLPTIQRLDDSSS